MKRLMPVLLAAALGCVSVPSSRGGGEEMRVETSEERVQRVTAHEAFMNLHRAWADGDGAAAFGMISVQGISDWLLARTRDAGDPDWSKQVAKLDAANRVLFDAWIKYNKRIQIPISQARPDPLPENLLNSKWLRETFLYYFEAEKANLKRIASTMQVRGEDVYVEGPGMSVLVRVNRTPSHIYSMVQEDGTWKFDYTVRPANRVR